ncbi:autotransporter assembly complex protein TamA [Arsenophonus sp. PmNCSU2021_1]|uniref:autotransporter assembly complex protein TamA n=1 Tax=Arsenophonus sp. PmNCSU2021_1 TaxID=3118989 RepID=UPI002FF03F5E
MPRYSLLCFLCMSMVVSVANGANLRLKVEGLTGELEKNVRIQLSNITQDEIAPDGRFQVRVDKAIRLGLRPLGYYEPTIEFSYQEFQPPSRPVLTAKVDPGKPVHVENVSITLNGAAKYDKDYAEMIARNTPPKGIILNHGDYEDFKQGFSRLAVRKGYFDAEMKKSQLGVSLAHRASYWIFDFNSGERYRFGAIKYEGSQIREDYLNNIVPFKQGDYYASEQLAEFNQRLVNTVWFNSAIVTPDITKAREKGTHILPMDAVLTPRARNHVELGGGYSTDVGPRVKATWNKPWINSRGQSSTSSLSLSQPEQIIDASYKIPLKKSPLEQYYAVQAGFKRTDLNDTQSDTTTLNLLRNWDYYKGWQYGVNLRWSLSHFTQANITNTTMLLYPGASLSRMRQRGGAMPYWGDSQRYTIDISNTTWASDIDFVVLQAQNVWIRTPWKGHRFVVRGHLGWIETNRFDKVPPDLRFFAGGDRSIRGYGYQKISPTNSQGKLTGASKLAVGSLEYQYNVTGNWWGAIFVDGGEAVNDFSKDDFKVGAGVGIRWVSPVGPIKLDIAAPVGDPDYSKVQFYIGLGAEL